MSLDADLERFAVAHAAELDAGDTFTLGRAAGIIARVHAAYLPNGMTVEQVEQLGRDSLRRHHPALAAELDADDR